MNENLNFESEKYEYYNNILQLKNSIKSEIIKKLLSEEDSKIKEDNINNNKIINKKSNKKTNNFTYSIRKFKPKSITLNNLMKENSTKILFKSKKTKKENKDKINKNEKKGIKDIKMENKNLNNKTEKKMIKTIDITTDNNININKRYFSPVIHNKKNIEFKEKELYFSHKNSEKKKQNFLLNNKLIISTKNEKIQRPKFSIYNEINQKLKNIFNNNEITAEKKINDFEQFINDNESEEFNYEPNIQKTLTLFKKGNKYIKKYPHLPKYHSYSNQEIIKSLIFKNILSFLTPIEQYIFSKTNKESLICYMKGKGEETESLLDKCNVQKEQIEKILNKNQNIKITKENFFNDNKLNQIFNLLNDPLYLNIFNDKSKVPDDNIIFVFKLFFLLIKGTDKLIELKNDIFWEKISSYFINYTNEFHQNDYLLGELVKKIMQQKLDFSEEKQKKIQDIINQIDLRQINPNTFKDISPTTSQFCYIIGYFLEFFGVIGKEWNPLENEYELLQQKISSLIKKINKIGLYLVKLKYKNKFK